MPPHAPGMRIGLFGGSFNPAHAGHRLATLTAMKRLRLDRVWWLVTPGNPLKDNALLPAIDLRVAAAQAVARHPRIVATGFEARIGSRFTHDTIAHLTRRAPGVAFVWIMGADSLETFHMWERWRAIAATVPIAVVDRPGATLSAIRARAAARMAGRRVPEAAAAELAGSLPPAWTFLHGPRSPLSSTALRGARHDS
ncbi:nicotinate-nucleotide adenylyltransferase [Methylopila sp. 73B]|uniref:nicotinate-nucleotide adenylyltransferase n=1 Tax=Methylopila sp. 73B TaxID=1120792 RepID=UPI0009E0125C|nr:nicotinate-nucleotide adenylyltransferase [Methylopila sp. 73B]